MVVFIVVFFTLQAAYIKHKNNQIKCQEIAQLSIHLKKKYIFQIKKGISF